MRDTWLWRSFDGSIWTIDTMKTDHMLNCMKMLYNELAAEFNLPIVNKTQGGYSSGPSMTDRRRIENVLMLMDELKSRTDLPGYMEQDFEKMVEILSLIMARSANDRDELFPEGQKLLGIATESCV